MVWVGRSQGACRRRWGPAVSLRRTGREDARLDLFSLARLVWGMPSAYRFGFSIG